MKINKHVCALTTLQLVSKILGLFWAFLAVIPPKNLFEKYKTKIVEWFQSVFLRCISISKSVWVNIKCNFPMHFSFEVWSSGFKCISPCQVVLKNVYFNRLILHLGGWGGGWGGYHTGGGLAHFTLRWGVTIQVLRCWQVV